MIVAVGAVLFWIVCAALHLGAGLPLLDSILGAVLFAAAPTFSMAQVPLIGEVEIERLPAYWSSIITLWLVGSACWFVGTREGGPAAIGLVPLPPFELLAWSVGATVAALGTMFTVRELYRASGGRDTRLLRELLPRTAKERRVFALLCFAAGIGEEIAYRGYSITLLIPLTGAWPAALLTSGIFGVLHAYQGWVGVLRTGGLGLLLAVTFLQSGSLWPAIIAHTLLDLIAGLLLGDRLILNPPEVVEGEG